MYSLIDLGPWSDFAINVTLRATLVLVMAAVACVLLRKTSASVRHLIWALGATGALMMPLMTLALPSWRIPILTAPDQTLAISVPDESSTVVFSGETSPVSPTNENPVGAPPRIAIVLSGAPKSTDKPLSIALCVAMVWAFGAVAVLVPMGVGLVRLRLLRRGSLRLTDPRWSALVDPLRSWLGLSHGVALYQADEMASPMTWGVFWPTILLPAGAEDWPADRLRSVLLHELAHIKRCDCLTQVVARLACAMYWFHPLAWLAAHRLRVERELACDDLVLQSGSKATEYAGHLLEVARGFRTSPGLAVAAVPMARASQIEGRLHAILDASRNRSTLSRRGASVVLVAAVALIVPLSVARFVDAAIDEVKSATMIVSGRVLDPDGKPFPGARLAIIGRRKLAALNARSENQYEALGHTDADAEGRYKVEVPRTSSVTHYEAYVLAAAKGFGLGWAEFNRDAQSPATDVKLRPEQIVEGRLVDSKGAPVTDVSANITSIGFMRKEIGGFDGINLRTPTPEGVKSVWPKPIKTDADGRFRIEGVGRGVRVNFGPETTRFARQGLYVEADGAKHADLTLRPAMPVSGRVTSADTGEPIRNAIIAVGTGPSPNILPGSADYRTDADGRYEANPFPGKHLQVTVYPPVGSPYLIFGKNFEGTSDTTKRVADLSVPRGVLITGRVTERGSNRPLAGASVFYEDGGTNAIEKEGTIPGWMAAVSSGADGRYSIAVTPKKGYLLVYGKTNDYVHEMMSGRELRYGKPGWERHYAHAFIPYQAKPGPEVLPMDVTLRPGVTIEGNVVGPDGRAVDQAEIASLLTISPFHSTWRGDFTIPVREGRFELHGVSPDRPVKCWFLDAKNGWGTTIEVNAAMAGKPLTVKLEKCGAAKLRFLDEKGQPSEKEVADLNLLASPGPGVDFYGISLTAEEKEMVSADLVLNANLDRRNYWQAPRSDAQGRITLPYLIPGATYRVYKYAPERGKNVFRWEDFTVAAGETLDLGDFPVRPRDR